MPKFKVSSTAMMHGGDIIVSERREIVRPWFQFSDLVEIVTLALLILPALVLPQRHWLSLATVFARADMLMRPGYCRARLEHLRQVADKSSPEKILLAALTDNIVIRLSALRQFVLPGWKPSISVQGADHVAAARQHGQGVILWLADTASSHHETHKALTSADLSAVHIGRPTHGFSRSRFGIRCLNPLRHYLEAKACRDFVTIDRGTTRKGVERLKAYLEDNAIVSIRVGDHASQVVRVPFANGYLRLAAGPMRLAHETGAMLCPVYTTGRITNHANVVIGPPLTVRSTSDQDLIESGNAYAHWLKSFVDEDPGLWRSWPIVASPIDTPSR